MSWSELFVYITIVLALAWFVSIVALGLITKFQGL